MYLAKTAFQSVPVSFPTLVSHCVLVIIKSYRHYLVNGNTTQLSCVVATRNVLLGDSVPQTP